MYVGVCFNNEGECNESPEGPAEPLEGFRGHLSGATALQLLLQLALMLQCKTTVSHGSMYNLGPTQQV